MKPHRLSIFASGSGTNAEQIIRYFDNHRSIEVAEVLTNNPHALVLQRAQRLGMPARIFSRSEFVHPDFVQQRIENRITHVVLAGFLWLVPQHLLAQFPHRIINIHPSLLPKFGGKGMYGLRVHEAVRQSGESQTGITIHEVSERYDEGRILFQAACAVLPADTAEQIAARVHALEYTHYPRIIEHWVLGEPGGSVDTV